MSTRYLVTVEPGADVDAVESALRTAGAETVNRPAPELPDVFVVTVADEPARPRAVAPGDAEPGEPEPGEPEPGEPEPTADAFVAQASRIPGVRVAERDAWVGFGGDGSDTDSGTDFDSGMVGI